MKLYYSPGACSLAPHIVANEAGVALEVERVQLSKHQTESGADFYAINPKGQVPTLQLDDGGIFTEGPVIARIIADRAGARSLLPAAGTIERYRVEEWQNFITSELHKGFSPLFNPRHEAPAKALQAALLRERFQWVDAQLAGKEYLTGADFTVADAYLFTVAGWAKIVKLDLGDLAQLQAYLARVAARPAVHKTLREEGLLA